MIPSIHIYYSILGLTVICSIGWTIYAVQLKDYFIFIANFPGI